MSKIKINSSLINIDGKENYNYNNLGIIKNNKVIYVDNDINMSLDLYHLILKRTSNEYEILLDFKNNKGYYKIDNLNCTFNLKIEIKKIIEKDRYLYIEYGLFINNTHLGKYKYKFSYEVI